MTERTEIHYNGFHIVADFYKGKFQGRAHGDCRLSADGRDIPTVVELLKQQVDAWQRDRQIILAREREEKHRAFLEEHGVPYQGVRESPQLRTRRVTHCYACKEHLNSAIFTECVACGWILCNCGACGCGWSGHGGPVQRIRLDRAQPRSESCAPGTGAL